MKLENLSYMKNNEWKKSLRLTVFHGTSTLGTSKPSFKVHFLALFVKYLTLLRPT